MDKKYHWDNIADDYEKWVSGNDSTLGKLLSQKRQETFLTLLDNPINKSILDLGCGEGIIGRLFSKENSVFGVDYSEKLINFAKKKDKTINYQITDISKKLPYSDNFFDIVLSNMVLMDIPEISILFSEIKRIIKTNGLFIFSIKHPCFEKVWNSQDNSQYKYLENFRIEKKIISKSKDFCIGYHRPIEHYVNEIINNGFRIIHFSETKVNSEINFDLGKNYDLIANDLFIGCLKND